LTKVIDKRSVSGQKTLLQQKEEREREREKQERLAAITEEQILRVIAKPSWHERLATLCRSLVVGAVSLVKFYIGWACIGTPGRMAVFMEAIYEDGRNDAAKQIHETAQALVPNRRARRAIARKQRARRRR
jgi:hypothetical protein